MRIFKMISTLLTLIVLSFSVMTAASQQIIPTLNPDLIAPPAQLQPAATPAAPIPGQQIVPTLSPGLIAPPAPSLTEIGGFTLPFGLDLFNPLHVALLIGAAGLLLVLLWLITVVLRLIFSRERTFPSWQPPYGMSTMLNPNSTVGRRQLWQQHAMADALPLPCMGGDYMARKILIGMNGTKLKGWRVIAGRISQYDMYGRVARTQTLLSSRVVRQIDAAARRSPRLTGKRAERAARSIARRILREFGKKMKRTPSLPISLDLRFRGSHGDVRIVFELHQCMQGEHWALIDQWEPEMQVPGSTIQENFTYALYGQRPAEKSRAFRKRLSTDLTAMLTGLLQPPPLPAVPVTPPPDSSSHTQTVTVLAAQPATELHAQPVSAAPQPIAVALPALIPAPDNEPLIEGDTTPLRPVDAGQPPTPPAS